MGQTKNNHTKEKENEEEAMKVCITKDNHRNFKGLRTIALPPMSREIYAGDMEFLPEPDDKPFTYLSFVMSKEGIFGLKNAPGFAPISQGNRADSFMLALLHVMPDAVMIGAGVLRGEPDMEWNVEHLFRVIPQLKTLPELLREFQNFRASLGKRDEFPPTFLATNSGSIDFGAGVFRNGAIKKYVVTGKRGADAIVRSGVNLKSLNTETLQFGEETLDQRAMMEFLRAEIHIETLFHEGGRQVADAVVREGLAQQLFLTHMKAHPAAEFGPEDAQYLFSPFDPTIPDNHQLRLDARIITERVDAEENATFLSIDVRDWRTL